MMTLNTNRKIRERIRSFCDDCNRNTLHEATAMWTFNECEIWMDCTECGACVIRYFETETQVDSTNKGNNNGS